MRANAGTGRNLRVELLSDATGPRVRAAILAFLLANAR
jgi:hypothetical protein